MSADLLTVDRDGPVAVLTLARPEKRNALSTALRDAIVATLDDLATDDDVRVVVITGAGGTFCAGFDLDEVMASADPDALFAHATTYHRAVHTFGKPLIAAVEGAAVAGGMDLALMCDLRVAASDARFGQPQVAMGVPAAYDLVASVVADPIARELCLTGRIVDAREALAVGLVHRVVEPGTALVTATALAAEIAAVAGSGAMKRAFVALQRPLFGDPPRG